MISESISLRIKQCRTIARQVDWLNNHLELAGVSDGILDRLFAGKTVILRGKRILLWKPNPSVLHRPVTCPSKVKDGAFTVEEKQVFGIGYWQERV